MSTRSFVTLRVRTLILLFVLGASLAFNLGSALAAQNRGAAAANAQTGSSQLNGQLIANGPVTVNGNKAITGSTVFTGSNIAVDCANGNTAFVNLGRLGRIELVAGTRLTLRFSDGMISGDLQDGKAVISTPPGVKVQVNTPDGVVSTDCAQSCVTPVAVQGFVQCVPVAAPAPVPARVPLPPAGLNRWAIVGILGGAGAAGAVAATTAGEEGKVIPGTAVSPTRP
jgi:hypothetical protein